MARITVTAGHGQYKDRMDNGAVAKDGTTEAAVAVEMRQIIKFYLERSGVEVVTDGVGNQNKSLPEAVSLIRGSAVAVEIHCNASAVSAAGGVEVLARPQHKRLAQQISRAIADVMGNKIRGNEGGYKAENSGQHSRLAYVSNGGLIVEMFFISNPDELKTYRAKKWLIGRAIAGALGDYVGVKIAG